VQKSKAQRRRERQEEEEARRGAEIASHLANLGETERRAEEKTLQSILLQQGLQLFDIPVRSCPHLVSSPRELEH
jgi:hypothetical protein